MSPLDLPARIPPHNLDAERAVLGAVLLEGRETLPRVIELLRSSDFYTDAHRTIYETMQGLFDRSEPVDLITLSEDLRRDGTLESVGGPGALALLVEHASIAAHLSAYAGIVRDMAVLRELIQTSTQIIGQAFEAKEDVQTLVDDAERKIFGLEMSAPQLVQRMLCSEAKVDSQAVRTGRLSASDWHRLTAAAGRLSEAAIFIDDSPGLTVLEARAKARRMKAEHGLDLLVIDYLQLMRGRASMESRQQEISEISRSLKALAKELNVPVVALSQLSRAVEARQARDFKPQPSDLRESGALEQDADVILFLYRQSQYQEDLPPDEANVADVIIGKQRNGPVGTVKVVFLPQYARFENVAESHRQPQPF